MSKMKSNIVFESYENGSSEQVVVDYSSANVERASYMGVTIKTAILIGVALISGMLASLLLKTAPAVLTVLLLISCITSFVCVMIGTRNQNAAMPCGIIYSIGEGLSLGLIAVLCNSIEGFEWIIPTAIAALFVIFCSMLVLYATKVIKPGRKIQAFIIGVLVSYLILSLIGGILLLFNVPIIYQILNFGPIAIAIAGILVLVGALSLLVDFETASRIVDNGCDKKFEWIAALGLMVSIVYLFVQIVRLLMIIASNNRD